MAAICRLCATLRKTELMTTITNATDEVCLKLGECCQLNISMEDSLPKSVCQECLQSLDSVYTFYSKVHEAQESLKVFFHVQNNINTQLETIVKVIQPVASEQLLRRKIDESLNGSTITVNEKLPDGSETQTIGRKCDNEMITVMEQSANETSLDEEVIEIRIDSDDKLEEEDEQMPTGAAFEKLLENISYTVDEASNEKLETIDENSKSYVNSYIDTEITLESMDECELANETAATTSEVVVKDRHLKNWSEVSWCCCNCSFIAVSFVSLYEHVQDAHDIFIEEMQYKCDDCQKTFTRYYMFINHIRRHYNSLALCCDVCQRHCADFEDLAAHRIKHAEDASDGYPIIVHCSKCGKGYLSQAAVQVHVRMQHMAPKKTYNCETCGKDFKRLSTLRVHERVHSDIKRYTCDICERGFRQKVNLDTHISTHMNEKSFQCSICQRFFKSSINLEKHILIHRDIRDFKCDHCSKKFRTKDEKLSHERTHTGEKPYKCTQCERSFRFRSTLTCHLNVHNGIRPYSCLECDHHFINFSNYSKHMKRRHKPDNTQESETSGFKVKRTKKCVDTAINSAEESSTYAIVCEDSNVSSANDEVIELSFFNTKEGTYGT